MGEVVSDRRKPAGCRGKPGPGRPKGSKNAADSARAKTAREALDRLGGSDAFVELYRKAERARDLAICKGVLTYLYDQSYGKAAEQDVPGKGTAVKFYIGLTKHEEAVIEVSRKKANGPQHPDGH
jgi:hypothetical protein